MATTALVVTGLTILAGTVSASAATGATVPLTVTPSTGLTGGASVTLTASGMAVSSPGNVLECNSDANQPTVKLGGLVNASISVGCNAPSLAAVVSTDASGALNSKFTVLGGTVGPPCGPSPDAATCPATDSTGGSPAADSALYPCPPTAAQLAKGDTCNLTFGDSSGDSAAANITFAASTPPTTVAPTTPGTTPATAPPTTKAPVTAAPTTVAPSTGVKAATTTPPAVATSPSTLAATGPGPAVGWLGAIGIVLFLLGLVLLLVLFEGPRRALAGIAAPGRIRKLSLPVHRHPEGSAPRQIADTATKLVGHVDHLGRRLGERAQGAPAATRQLTRRVASASARSAAWLLGR